MNRDDLFKRIANSGDRRATCGACGCERLVTGWLRHHRDMQFRARPDQATDMFYCGCQNQDDPEPW